LKPIGSSTGTCRYGRGREAAPQSFRSWTIEEGSCSSVGGLIVNCLPPPPTPTLLTANHSLTGFSPHLFLCVCGSGGWIKGFTLAR
jgi:hypothetical protein